MSLALVVQLAASSPQGTASIEGVVVKLGTTDAVVDADVELSRVEGVAEAPMTDAATAFFKTVLDGFGPSGAFPPAVIANEVQYAKSDASGRFLFRNLKPGKYRLVAARSAIGTPLYPAEYGQHDPRSRGLNFPVRTGESLRDLRLEMATPSVITGTVFDYDGEPMGHVGMLALIVQYRNGRSVPNVEQVTYTDERGQYRLPWLSPGKYYVAAVVQDPFRKTMQKDSSPAGRRGLTDRSTSPYITKRMLPSGEVVEETYAVVYNGGVTDLDQARPIDLQPGMSASAVDIPMAAGRLPVHHIRGVALDSAGQPIAGGALMLHPQRWSPSVLIVQGTTDRAGNFDLATPPGNYLLSLVHRGVDRAMQVAYQPVVVSGSNVEGVRVIPQPGATVNGRIVIEGSTFGQSASTIRVNLTRVPDIDRMPPPMAPVALPGRGAPGPVVELPPAFPISVFPGEYTVSMDGVPDGFYVKSLRMGSVDLMTTSLRIAGGVSPDAIDVVLASDAGRAFGRVGTGASAAATNVVVALVPESTADRQRTELYKNTMTDAAGRYEFSNVRPGRYKLFAWEYAEQGIWTMPSVLQPVDGMGKSIEVNAKGDVETQLTVLPKLR